MAEFSFNSPSLLENQNKVPKELIKLPEESTELPKDKESIDLSSEEISSRVEKNLQGFHSVLRFIYGGSAEEEEEEKELQSPEDTSESNNKPSLARDIGSLADRTIFGLPEVVEDTVRAATNLILDENEIVMQKFPGFVREFADKSALDVYDWHAKTLGATIEVNGKKVPATTDNLNQGQKDHIIKKSRAGSETLTGQALEIATMIYGVTSVFKQLPKGVSNWRKALISEQVVVQSLSTDEERRNNIANVVFDWGQKLEDDDLIKSFATNPVFRFLAADEGDSREFLRLKQGLTDAVLFGSAESAFKLIGITLKGGNNLSQAMYNKGVDQLKKREIDKLFEKVLVGLKSEIQVGMKYHTLGKAQGSPSSSVLGIGLPSISLVKKTADKLSEDEAQLIRQTTKENANVLSRGASFLYRIKQRWFTSNGYAPRKAWESEQHMIRRTRALQNEADTIAKRLQYFLDRAIHEYDGDLVKNITNALESKPSTLEPAERLAELQSKFNLPEKVAVEVLEGRNMVDRLSQIVLDSNIGTEATREAITNNLTTYTRRSYRLFEEKGFIPSNSAKRKAEEFFRDQYLAKEYGVDLKKIDNGLEGEDFGLTSAQLAEATTHAEREVISFLTKAEAKNLNQFMAKVMQVRPSLLSERKQIPKVLRELMGEIESPPLNIVQSINKLIQIVESNRYYNEVLELGGSVPANKDLYAESLARARAALRNTDLTQEGEKEIGEFVRVRLKTEGFVLGKITAVTDKGYTVEIKNSKTGATKKRQISLGEATDNLEVIPRNDAVTSLADKLYLDQFSDSALGDPYTKATYIFKQNQGDTSIFNTQIDMPGNPLHEQWTTKEYAESLAGLEEYAFASRIIQNSPGFHTWRRVKGVSQSLKTVWDHTTQLRNGLGGMQFALNNGMIPFKGGAGNYEILIKQMGGLSAKDFTRQYNKLQRLGIVNTSVMGGEWQALMKSADGAAPQEWESMLAKFVNKVKDPVWKGKPSDFDSVKTKWYQLPQKLYMATDDFFKMNAYATELDFLKRVRTDTPIDILEDEAANIVRNTFPNYDVIPKGFKSLRDLPFGNFVAFIPEIIRTQANILKQTIKELKDPALRQRGLQRLAGGLAVHGGWAGAGMFAKNKLMWDDDQLEAINILTEAPWSDRHNKIPVEINGKLAVIDPRYLNPYDVFHGFFQDISTQISKGEYENLDADTIIQQATFKAVTEMMSFATDNAMVADVIIDLTVAMANDDGRRGDGKKIFKSKDIDDIVIGSIEYLAETIALPGFIYDFKKPYDVATGRINPQTNKPFDPAMIITEMVVGINPKEVAPREALVFAGQRYHGVKAHRIQRPTMEQDKGDPKDWANDFIRQNAEKFIAGRDLFRKVRATKMLGNFADFEIADLLSQGAGLNNAELEEIIDNTFSPFTVTENTINKYNEYYADHPDKDRVLENMLDYVHDIRGIPFHSYQLRDIEQIKRLQEGKGTGFYRLGVPRNYEEVADRYKYGLSFSEGGEVTNVAQVKENPEDRLNPFTGEPYSNYEEDKDRTGLGIGGKVIKAFQQAFNKKAYHGTLEQNVEELELRSSDLGSHVGTREHANARVDDKIIEGPMQDALAQRNAELDFAFKSEVDLKRKNADPQVIKDVQEEIKRLEESVNIEDYSAGANIMPLQVKVEKSLEMPDIGEWRDLNSSIAQLLESPLVINADGTKNKNIITKLKTQLKNVKRFESKYQDSRDFWVSTEAKKIRAKVVSIIKSEGYDSIKYKNLHEGAHWPVSKDVDDLTSYIILDPKNIRSKFADFDPAKAESARLLDYSGGRVTNFDGGEAIDTLRSFNSTLGVLKRNAFIPSDTRQALGFKQDESLQDFIYSTARAAGYRDPELNYGGAGDAARHGAAGLLAGLSRVPPVSLFILNAKEGFDPEGRDFRKMDTTNNEIGFRKAYDNTNPIKSREDFVKTLGAMRNDFKVLIPSNERIGKVFGSKVLSFLSKRAKGAEKSAEGDTPAIAKLDEFKQQKELKELNRGITDEVRERMAKNQALVDAADFEYQIGDRILTPLRQSHDTPPLEVVARSVNRKGEKILHVKGQAIDGAGVEAFTIIENKLLEQPGVTKFSSIPELKTAKVKPKLEVATKAPEETITPYEYVPEPATREQMFNALKEASKKGQVAQRDKINLEIPENAKVGLRLDIPAYTGHNVWVPTLTREGKYPKNVNRTSHRATAAIRNPNLALSESLQKKALKVKEGGQKAPFAVIKGNLVNRTDEENYLLAQKYLKDPEWTQVGYNPEKHSYFFDRKTGQPVLNGEEAIQVGPLVLVKKAKFGNMKDYLYATGGGVFGGPHRSQAAVGGSADQRVKAFAGIREALNPEQQAAYLKASANTSVTENTSVAREGSTQQPTGTQEVSSTVQRFNPMGGFSPESLRIAQSELQERVRNQPVAQAKVAWGEEGWINPHYDPDHNKGGYHRFDTSTPGSGMQFSRTYADGARTFDVYNKLTSGQPGYDHAQNARNTLKQMGTTVANATDMQKFEAMDLSQRSAQWKNTRPKRKVSVGQALKTIASVAAFVANPSVVGGFTAHGNIKRLSPKPAGTPSNLKPTRGTQPSEAPRLMDRTTTTTQPTVMTEKQRVAKQAADFNPMGGGRGFTPEFLAKLRANVAANNA